MRSLPLLILALGLAVTAIPAGAQETGKTSFTLVSAQNNADYVWREEGGTSNNPALIVPANAQITFTVKKGTDPDGIPHNLKVGTTAESEETIMNAGDEFTYTTTAPASGSAEYVCTIHPTTMKGTMRVAGTGGDGGDGENGAPGFALAAVVVGLAGAALLVRRRL